MSNQFHIITFGKKPENLLKTLESKTIGSFLRTFESHVKKGSIAFLHCKSLIWGAAVISSDYFYDESPLWSDKMYPHRFKINQIYLVDEPIVLNNGHYNVALKELAGTGWAYSFIFSPKPLPAETGMQIYKDVVARREVNSDLMSIKLSGSR